MQNNENMSIVRDNASGAGVHLVQAGWTIRDREGERIGQVVARGTDTMFVEVDGDRVPIPTRLIAEEDEAGKLATLDVSSEDVQRAMPTSREASPPLT